MWVHTVPKIIRISARKKNQTVPDGEEKNQTVPDREKKTRLSRTEKKYYTNLNFTECALMGLSESYLAKNIYVYSIFYFRISGYATVYVWFMRQTFVHKNEPLHP